MQIKQILNYYNNLDDFLNKKLPIKVSFYIAKNKQKFLKILQIFDNQRKILLKRYAEKDDNNQIIIDKNDNVKIKDVKNFNKELTALLELNQEIQIDKITLSDLDMCGNGIFDVLTPKDLISLSFMIQDNDNIIEEQEIIL